MAKEGRLFIVICVLLALSVRIIFPAGKAVPALFVFLAAFGAFFFRDPERTPPRGENLIIAPADGKIVYVGDVEGGHFFEEPSKKVSIFMSLLDVHVNRAPVSGRVARITYNKGRYFRADCDKASLDNEQNWVIMENDTDRFAFVQIAGLVARRIVCRVSEGQLLTAGEKVGLIMFGSRVDIYIPHGWNISVQEGERVRGGETIIGEL